MGNNEATVRRSPFFYGDLSAIPIEFSFRWEPPSPRMLFVCHIRPLRISYSYGIFTQRCSAFTGKCTALQSQQCSRRRQIIPLYDAPISRDIFGTFRSDFTIVGATSSRRMCHYCQLELPRTTHLRGVARRRRGSAQPIRALRPTANISATLGTFLHPNPPIVARTTCGQLSVALGVNTQTVLLQ